MAKARSMAYFGEGQGPIHLDNVRCSGTETSLGQCPAEGQEGHDCRHSEDAGVICDYTLDPTGNGASAMQSCGRRLSRQRRQRRIIGGEKSLRLAYTHICTQKLHVSGTFLLLEKSHGSLTVSLTETALRV